jgi:hypothetical protein
MVTVARDPEDLQGLQLAGVAFVRDYVELLFDGPILRCYAPPEVVLGGRCVRFPEDGSRDALCELIGADVAAVRLGEDSLSIELGGNRQVRVEFTSAWEMGRDAAEFVPLLDGSLSPEQKVVW